ncbi:MAG: tRNA dihydrouridine(20/20a) synthase DusA [Cycloclasticus sp.]|nr:MAG: tRNA dihydrouridine(20/20a) synthase DusA [Cycloclasticus sp.]
MTVSKQQESFKTKGKPIGTLSIAPMMDWTDKHCRVFHRLLSPNALLYTEMITTGALKHGDKERFLSFNEIEQPLALQLGGSNPADMATCAELAEHAGFKEVNINVGCPSDRVQNGRFGACLMSEPALVAECVSAMLEKVSIPITIKTRTGIDDFDSQAFLVDFVGKTAEVGCRTFIIHARKAILKGLSPKENRTIPELNYDRAYTVKKEFPDLTVIVNGGVKTVGDIERHWQHVDGVMIGREAYHNPFFLAEAEHHLFSQPLVDRVEVLNNYLPYVESELSKGVSLQSISRHLLGLFAGQPMGKHWRRYLSENARFKHSGTEVLLAALEQMKPYQ